MGKKVEKDQKNIKLKKIYSHSKNTTKPLFRSLDSRNFHS